MANPDHHPSRAAVGRQLEGRVETIVGIALIVISALEIWFFIRVVSSNLNVGR